VLKAFLGSCRNEWLMAVRQKMIFIVLFIIPILVNLLLGFELSQNQIKNIPMAVCDMDNSSIGFKGARHSLIYLLNFSKTIKLWKARGAEAKGSLIKIRYLP